MSTPAPAHPLSALAAAPPGPPPWPGSLSRVRPWLVHYLGWDGRTARQAWIILPSGWGPANPPPPAPLVISPHGRNNLGWNNAVTYWQNLPGDGSFILICPDGLGRAHDAASDPFDQPPTNPGLFSYGYSQEIDDLARMPQIVRATLPWLQVDLESVYVLGSSMGGQETLLLAARYPNALASGTGKLAGAVAFDAPCDMAAQCAYLTHLPPLASGANPPAVAALMLEEINSKPADVSGFNQAALFFDDKTRTHWTIGQLLNKLPTDQALWDERSALSYVAELSSLPFPLRIYWSDNDTVVANQATEHSGKLYQEIMAANPNADVTQVEGAWAHSVEFVPNDQLGDALRIFGLIP